MNNVCVYAGSNPGVDAVYAEAARKLGHEIARRDWGWSTAAPTWG